MEIFNLSFNAVMLNIKDHCTSFFCPTDCTFIRTLQSDLGIDLSNLTSCVEFDKIRLGRVYNETHVKRLPMVYVHDTEVYCDITIMLAAQSTFQVVILKYDEHPDVVTVERNYDAYKLFYEYVGGFSDLKQRMSYEYGFMRNVSDEVSSSSREEAFIKNVDEQIIQKLFE